VVRRSLAGAFVVCLVAAVAALVTLAVPSYSATSRVQKRVLLTGRYQLYCPDPVETPIVLHVRATARIIPVKPASKHRFEVSGFQTEVTFPQGVASALAQMSPITGKVTGTVFVVGATPRNRPVAESFVAVIPRSVPAAGFNFWVPARGADLGTFTASSSTAVVQEASRFRLSLTVGRGRNAQTRVLACTAFADATRDFQPSQPWVGTKEPPFSDAITPVIALGRS
jgi:hypothetical protein